jgi:DNA-binding CsgD family transcriptional regulator
VPGLVEPLSERELEVLRLLAAGKPNQQIAKELVVAVNTVKKHVAHILDKLGAANRTEATARARELGLLRSRGRLFKRRLRQRRLALFFEPGRSGPRLHRCYPATPFGYRPAPPGRQEPTRNGSPG